ncbi:type II toxin-antitoxin system RatA family toxin [Streptomyces daliensis]|uniref:SRPBCC family protein n=1 Tax=Streptomyces daliensis TaxID=299421 RepID=A0A8T4J3E3_9ACTN|nr:SRPBCC family protein [Streptomyces daliensis]
MRSVDVALSLPEADPEEVYERVKQFARYPDLVPEVRSVVTHEITEGRATSDWEVYFRNGILRWSEADEFDRNALTIDFAQLDGDFELFTGTWRISATERGARVDFQADFDFGMPSLQGILDPVAERVIRETIARIVLGLFGTGTVLDDAALARAVEAASPETRATA